MYQIVVVAPDSASLSAMLAEPDDTVWGTAIPGAEVEALPEDPLYALVSAPAERRRELDRAFPPRSAWRHLACGIDVLAAWRRSHSLPA